MKYLLVASLSLALIGCAAPYNTNFPLIEKRMSFDQVTQLLGKPSGAESGPNESKILFYRLASSPLDTDGSDTKDYWVQLQDGEVIGYGERRDAATLQRQAQQYSSAWNSVRLLNETNKSIIETNKANQRTAPRTTHCTNLGNTTTCSTY